jgi:uncharacterized iron-regulated membrane protein
MKLNDTTKTFKRTMMDAFPQDYANTITCYKRRPFWRELLRIAITLALIFGTVGLLLLWLMPK